MNQLRNDFLDSKYDPYFGNTNAGRKQDLLLQEWHLSSGAPRNSEDAKYMAKYQITKVDPNWTEKQKESYLAYVLRDIPKALQSEEQ